MLEFYIQESGQYTKKDIIIPATLNTTFDETLDSAEIVLKASNNETEYEPDTRCYFTDGTNRIANMIVVSDKVERLTHGTGKYRHTLQLAQNTRLLQKHLVRNSSFSQPRDKYKRQWLNFGCLNLSVNEMEELSFNYNEKLVGDNNGNVTLKILFDMKAMNVIGSASQDIVITSLTQCQYVTGSYQISAPATVFSWQNFSANDTVGLYVNIHYTTGSDVVSHTDYTASNFPINKEIEFPIVVDTSRIIDKITVYLKTPSTYMLGTTDCSINMVGYGYDAEHPGMGSFLNVYAYAEVYTWTMYDILNTIRSQYFLDTQNFGVGETEKSFVLYKLPSSGEFYNILKNTIAPNFTFTGATVYECLVEIFKYYDAIFKMDQDNVLGIEYLNEYNHQRIVTTFSNKLSTFSEENFTTGYVSYFENALVEETFTSGLRSKQLGVVNNEGDDAWTFILPHNIQSIIKAEVLVKEPSIGTGGRTRGYYRNWLWVDITNLLITKDIYSTLSDVNKMGYLYYLENNIPVGGKTQVWILEEVRYTLFIEETLKKILYGNQTTSGISYSVSSTSNYQTAKIKITYTTKVDGRTRIENETSKYNGEMIVNQANGAVDLNKMGLNMLGLSYKLGQPTLAMTQSITNWNDRVIKGQIYEHNNERWLANIVKYTFYKDNIVCNIDFIKNYNALSQRIQVDRQKRLSQISTDLTVKSEDNYCEYIYATSFDVASSQKQQINLDYRSVWRSITMAFGITDYRTEYKVDFTCITPYVNNLQITRYDRKTQTSPYIANVYIPMVKYASGNALCFEMSMDSPITAGVRTYFTDADAGYSENGLYTDNGWADSLDVKFCEYGEDDFDDNFPYIQSGQLTQRGLLDKLHYFKKPNEIFALNYELIHLVAPLTVGIDFIGNALIKSSGLLGDGNAKIKFYYSTSEVYSPFDLVGIGTSLDATATINGSPTTTGIEIKITPSGTIPEHITSWSVCDSQGNILFASNTDLEGYQYSLIYFYTRHSRYGDVGSQLYYTLQGISTNGTVKWFSDSSHLHEITSTLYGETVYYQIVSNEHYSAPSPASGSLVANDSNFTITGFTMSKTFSPCILITHNVDFIFTRAGVSLINYSTNGGSTWTPLTYQEQDFPHTTTIAFDDGTELWWYAVADTGYILDSGVPYDAQHHGTESIIGQGISIAPTATAGTYQIVGTSTNGTVKWYSDSERTQQITQASYGTYVYWKILPNIHYKNDNDTGGAYLITENFDFQTQGQARKTLPACEPKQYTLNGTSLNGVVKWYYSETYSSERIVATYGETVYYKITANSGYQAPSPDRGSIVVDDSNFTIEEEQGMAFKWFSSCKQLFNVNFLFLDDSIERVMLKVGSGSWEIVEYQGYRPGTITKQIADLTQINYYEIPSTGYAVDDQAPIYQGDPLGEITIIQDTTLSLQGYSTTLSANLDDVSVDVFTGNEQAIVNKITLYGQGEDVIFYGTQFIPAQGHYVFSSPYTIYDGDFVVIEYEENDIRKKIKVVYNS